MPSTTKLKEEEIVDQETMVMCQCWNRSNDLIHGLLLLLYILFDKTFTITDFKCLSNVNIINRTDMAIHAIAQELCKLKHKQIPVT
jgi:hypothetical protein